MATHSLTRLPRHVAQRLDNDCVIATVAMVANLSYEEVAARGPVEAGSRRLTHDELHRLLVAATGVAWEGPHHAWLRRIGHPPKTDETAVVIIRRPWRWWTQHCVARQGGWIHDPEFSRGYLPEEYPRAHWLSLSFYRPLPTNRLIFVQQFRL